MTSLTFSKIHGLDKRNPNNTAMLYSHGGSEAGTASLSLCHNIHSSDAAAIEGAVSHHGLLLPLRC